MISPDPDLFSDPALGFAVCKPPHWQFLPPAWSPTAKLRGASNPDAELWRHAQLPFCCASGQHRSVEHVYPTLQVAVRPLQQQPARGLASTILESQLQSLQRHYPGFELIDASTAATLAGHPANRIDSHFQLPTTSDDGTRLLPVNSTAWLVFAPGRAFTVGWSRSPDPDYADEAASEVILASLRIA